MSGDLISRQAVLEMAYDMSEIDGEHFTAPCMVVDVEDIQKLPSVNPQESKWIPVSEILQEIKKEIELKEKTLTDKYGQTKYGVWTDDVCNVFDKYIEKYFNT